MKFLIKLAARRLNPTVPHQSRRRRRTDTTTTDEHDNDELELNDQGSGHRAHCRRYRRKEIVNRGLYRPRREVRTQKRRLIWNVSSRTKGEGGRLHG